MNPRALIASFLHRIAARFEGARWTPERSYLFTSLQSARFDASTAEWETLVAKSRYFEANSALVNRLADLFETYTVGPGLAIEPASSDPTWNKKAKQWWADWEELPDISSRQSFGSLLGLVARGWFIDGESDIHLTVGESGRPRLELIEAHRIKTPKSFQEDALVWGGIRHDSKGRPIGYFVASDSGPGKPESFQEIPAERLIPVAESSRPGQVRGLPFLYSVINTLHDLEDLRLLEMQVAKVSSVTAIQQTTPDGEGDPDDIYRNGGGGAPVSAGDDGAGDYYKKALPGQTVMVKPGHEIKQVAATRPSVVTMEYWRDLRAEVCNGVGIPYVLAFPESMQGTVYRGALDMAHAYFMARHQVIAKAAARIYAYVIGTSLNREALLKGAPADWKRVRIHPPKACNVDVGRNSAAMLQELAAGTTSYSEIFGAKGEDWREQLEQRKDEQDFIEKLGLKIQVGQVPSQAMAAQQSPGASPFDDEPEPMRRAA